MSEKRGPIEKKFTLLSIDDDRLFLDSIKRNLRKKSFAVEIAENYTQAAAILEKVTINLILLDVELPGTSGLSVLENLVLLYIEKHGGTIDVAQPPEGGTVFRITLPNHETEAVEYRSDEREER